MVLATHHVGIAVDDLDAAIATYARLFGAELEHRAALDDQGVEAASLHTGTGRIELLAPVAAPTRRSGASSRVAGRACITSPFRSPMSPPSSSGSAVPAPV